MLKRKKKSQEEIENNKKNTLKRNEFFLKIWKSRPHLSEVSGSKLYEPVSSAYFHHILAKNKYPEAEFDEENIILLTLEEHDNVEMNPSKYEEVNKRRETLKIKYNII
jgi:5-methylcytosine-specific restriction endonuclease McrA